MKTGSRMKNHWPLLFAALALIVSIILGIAASNSTDTGVAIAVGVIIFMFLLPLAGAVIGGWYGWRISSPLKWMLAPAVYVATVLYLIIGDLISDAGSVDIGSDCSVGLFTGIACLCVEIIASIIAWLVRRKSIG